MDDDHSSSPVITDGIKQPTRKHQTGRLLPAFALAGSGETRSPIWPCSVRGFACHPCCHGRGALLPHLFTLTRLRPPSPFRATARLRRSGIFSVPLVLRVAPTGRYPAHCPAEFGLSSHCARLREVSRRLSGSLQHINYTGIDSSRRALARAPLRTSKEPADRLRCGVATRRLPA